MGASSLFTRATRDIVYGVTDYFYANGLFARYAPVKPFVFLAEGDSVYQSLTWNGHRGGFAAFVQADYEPTQGFHLMLTAEAMNSGTAGEPVSYDGWVSAVWFLLPHVDHPVRRDLLEPRRAADPGEPGDVRAGDDVARAAPRLSLGAKCRPGRIHSACSSPFSASSPRGG